MKIFRLSLSAMLLVSLVLTLLPLQHGLANSPEQANRPVIGPENAASVGQIARLGRGWVDGIAYSPDGNWLGLAGSIGLWLFDANNLNAEPRLLASRSPLAGLVFSPDSARVATAGQDTVQLWDVAGGTEIARLDHETVSVYSVAFSPDGTQLASSGSDGAVRIWDLSGAADTSVPVAVLEGHLGQTHEITFSPDGTFLASAGQDGTVRIWQAATSSQSLSLACSEIMLSLAISPDGRYLAAGGHSFAEGENAVCLWDTSSWEQVARPAGHSDSITGLAFSPEGSRLASAGSYDGRVQVWEVPSGSNLATLDGGMAGVFSVDYRPGGEQLAARYTEGMVRVWDVASGAEVAVLSGFNDWVNDVVISPDSGRLLSVTRDSVVQMWDIAGQQVLFDLTMVDTDDRQLDITHALHYRPDGTPQVAIGNLAGEVRVFDLAGGGPAQRFQAHTEWVSAATFSPDGQVLATAGADNLVRLWNTQTWEEVASLSGHTDLISLLAFSPDGQTLVSSSGLPGSEDPALRVWNVAAANLLYSLSEHTDGVYAVAFSPNGTYLATAGWDDTLRVYQVEGGLVQQNVPITNDSPANPVFSPTEPLLAYAEVDGTAALLNVDTGESRRLSSHEGPVEALVFSPDGRLLATADQSGTIYLWDVAGGMPLATLTGHRGVAFELAFSLDGTLLISGGLDGTIRLWGVQ